MQSDLDNMSIDDLCDLLVLKTDEFMKLLERRNSDGFTIRNLKLEVEKIQAAIESRKSKKQD